MAVIRQIASFLRWRLVPIRYAGRVARVRSYSFRRRNPPTMEITRQVERSGYALGMRIDESILEKIVALYRPRKFAVIPTDAGHPFVNLVTNEDVIADNPLWRLVFSPEIIDVARDYFGGYCTLDSVQVMYSWQTSGPLRDSQKWHKDYGDSKSLHFMIYLNDVIDDSDGPFVFVDKVNTRKIHSSPIIRRIDDDSFLAELGSGDVIRFLGAAGEYAVVDPAVCYHYGSRCRSSEGRLALFITFNSTMPFVPAHSLIARNSQRILELGNEFRPDLGLVFLNRLLGV